METQLKVLLFDLDGTLVGGSYPSLWEVLKTHGFQPERKVELPSREKFRKFAHNHDSLFHLLEREGWGISGEKGKNMILEEMTAELYLREGVKDVLSKLKEKYTLNLCSDNEIGKKTVKKFHLTPFFDHLFISNEVGYLKDETGFWDQILDHYRSLSPSNFVIIGDDPIADIQVPKKLGMHTVLLPSIITVPEAYKTNSSQESYEPEYRLETISALPSLLEKKIG